MRREASVFHVVRFGFKSALADASVLIPSIAAVWIVLFSLYQWRGFGKNDWEFRDIQSAFLFFCYLGAAFTSMTATRSLGGSGAEFLNLLPVGRGQRRLAVIAENLSIALAWAWIPTSTLLGCCGLGVGHFVTLLILILAGSALFSSYLALRNLLRGAFSISAEQIHSAWSVCSFFIACGVIIPWLADTSTPPSSFPHPGVRVLGIALCLLLLSAGLASATASFSRPQRPASERRMATTVSPVALLEASMISIRRPGEGYLFALVAPWARTLAGMATIGLPLLLLMATAPRLMEGLIRKVMEGVLQGNDVSFFLFFLAPVILQAPFILAGMLFTTSRVGKHVLLGLHSLLLPIRSKLFVRVSFLGLLLISPWATLFFVWVFEREILFPHHWFLVLSILTSGAVWIGGGIRTAYQRTRGLEMSEMFVGMISLALALVGIYGLESSPHLHIPTLAFLLSAILFNYYAMHWMWRRF